MSFPSTIANKDNAFGVRTSASNLLSKEQSTFACPIAEGEDTPQILSIAVDTTLATPIAGDGAKAEVTVTIDSSQIASAPQTYAAFSGTANTTDVEFFPGVGWLSSGGAYGIVAQRGSLTGGSGQLVLSVNDGSLAADDTIFFRVGPYIVDATKLQTSIAIQADGEGLPQRNSQQAETIDRGRRTPNRAVTQVDGSLSISGTYSQKDLGYSLLFKVAQEGGIFGHVFIQHVGPIDTRTTDNQSSAGSSSVVFTHGQGPASCGYRATITSPNTSGGQNDQIQAGFEAAADGSNEPFVFPGQTLADIPAVLLGYYEGVQSFGR